MARKTVTPVSRLAQRAGKYSRQIARERTAARRKMRPLVPRSYELAYENYNALGVGYGPGQKALDFTAVREVGLALPDVRDGTTRRGFALKLRGKLLACEASMCSSSRTCRFRPRRSSGLCPDS